jgi:hypothetical protein
MTGLRPSTYAFALLVVSLGASAAATLPPGTPEVFTVEGARVAPTEFNGDLRFLPKAATQPRERYRRSLTIPSGKTAPATPLQPQVSAFTGPSVPMPPPLQNFPGISHNDTCTGGQCGQGWPPDPNGDVGVNHYIQAVNTSFVIWSKSGTQLVGITEDQLWSAAGASPCNGNSQGDPVAVYDAQADRWIVTQLGFGVNGLGDPVSPFYECIAVSKSGDPVSGGWYFYAMRVDTGNPGEPPVGALNDYPKFGIWTDCLYMSANEFQFPGENFIGTLFASFSRADMYAGMPVTWSLGFINNSTGPFSMLPSNLSGRAYASVPPGTPNYFVSESTTAFNYEVRKFVAGPNCGAGGFLGPPALVTQSSYDFNLNEAPQPNTANTLDSLGDRLMQRAQYRKVGNKESVWVVHTVQTAAGRLAPQWAQLDVTGGTVAPDPVQEQTFAPDAVLWRWMSSLAVDGQGNMAVGYSTSNGSAPNFPSISYAGRLVGDPLNQLPQSETQLVAGQGSQTNNCGGAPCDRWGDYSAMSVDPADDCTFWYTNEYYSSLANGISGNWQTRIGAFKFPGCVSLPPTTTALTSSANPSVVGLSVTFTATVTGTNPTGAVKFDDGGTTIVPCGAVALTGSGNSRTATCVTSALTAGSHTINASYQGDASNAPSSASLLQNVAPGVPGTATIVTNPYGPVSVQGATLVGNTISNMTPTVVVQLGSILPPAPSSAEIDFQGLNLAAGSTLTIKSGANGQFVFLVNLDANASALAGMLQAQGGNGAFPPQLYVKNKHGFTIYAAGGINAPSGLGLDTSINNFSVAQPIVNAGTLDGGSALELVASRINGGGAFKGNAIVVRTNGNANNPVHGAFFLMNGLQLFPSTGNSIALTLNAYGLVPQFMNLEGHGDMSVWMPSAWPPGSTVPVNNAVVPPNGVRAAGVPDPAYGGGSIIVQTSGALTLVDGGTHDFVFPGGIALKAGTLIDTGGVQVNQGWTTSGQAFQGTFFEAPMIQSSNGFIQSYTNNLNWVNFSTFPATPVRAFMLVRNPNSTASFIASDGVTPHLNTYSVLINAAAQGQCWNPCLINSQPVNMYGP